MCVMGQDFISKFSAEETTLFKKIIEDIENIAKIILKKCHFGWKTQNKEIIISENDHAILGPKF